MPEAVQVVRKEDGSGKGVERFAWGLLLIWIGAVLLVGWGWGVGLFGAGTIVLAAHAWRGHLGLRFDLGGVLFGVMLVICGVWILFRVPVEIVPVLFIAGGIALLVSTRRTSHGSPGAASHHRA